MFAITTAFGEADVTATMCPLFLVHFHGDFGIPFRLTTQVLSKHTSSTTHDISSHFGLISNEIFSFRSIPTKTFLSKLATENTRRTNQTSRNFQLR